MAWTTPAEWLSIWWTAPVISWTELMTCVTAPAIASSEDARLVGERGPGLDLGGPDLHRLDGGGDDALDLADEPGDLLGGAAGALGELADLVGDDREALALLAGPGGLDGGVEGEEVGLLGDVVDRLDDRADLLGLGGDLGDLARGVRDGTLDPVHPVDRLLDGGLAVGGRRPGAARRRRDRFGRERGVADGAGEGG